MVPTQTQEYYDYPDYRNVWLANLEPDVNVSSGSYEWRHVSDVYDILDPTFWDLPAGIISDYQGNVIPGDSADADGDGVSDSVWVRLPDMSSSKGRPIFAAVRVVDNGGMLNVNTAYKFNPAGSLGEIDGSSQMQINLAQL